MNLFELPHNFSKSALLATDKILSKILLSFCLQNKILHKSLFSDINSRTLSNSEFEYSSTGVSSMYLIIRLNNSSSIDWSKSKQSL